MPLFQPSKSLKKFRIHYSLFAKFPLWGVKGAFSGVYVLHSYIKNGKMIKKTAKNQLQNKPFNAHIKPFVSNTLPFV